jgi:hypothetical protein
MSNSPDLHLLQIVICCYKPSIQNGYDAIQRLFFYISLNIHYIYKCFKYKLQIVKMPFHDSVICCIFVKSKTFWLEIHVVFIPNLNGQESDWPDYAYCRWSRGSSVGIVSDYGLDDRGSIPDRAEYFSSCLCVQTGSGVHPASYTMGTRGPFSRGKARSGRDADHSAPSRAEVKYE